MTGAWVYERFLEDGRKARRASELVTDHALRWATAMAVRHNRCGVLVSHRVGSPSLVSVSAAVPAGYVRYRWPAGDDESRAYDVLRPMAALEV